MTMLLSMFLLTAAQLDAAPEWHAAQAAHGRQDCKAEAEWLSRLPGPLADEEAAVLARVDALRCAGETAEAARLAQARLAAAPPEERARWAAIAGGAMEDARRTRESAAQRQADNPARDGQARLRQRATLAGASALVASAQLVALAPAWMFGMLVQDAARKLSFFLVGAPLVLWPLFYGARLVVPLLFVVAPVGVVAAGMAALLGVGALVLLRDASAARGRVTGSLVRPVVFLVGGLVGASLIMLLAWPLFLLSVPGTMSASWSPTQEPRVIPGVVPSSPWSWLVLSAPLFIAAGLSVVTGSILAVQSLLSP